MKHTTTTHIKHTTKITIIKQNYNEHINNQINNDKTPQKTTQTKITYTPKNETIYKHRSQNTEPCKYKNLTNLTHTHTDNHKYTQQYTRTKEWGKIKHILIHKKATNKTNANTNK